MTFSLSPSSWSTLPLSEASVSTLVVSWKEAAEMKLSVASEALVRPNSIGSPSAVFPPSCSALPFARANSWRSRTESAMRSVSPTSFTRTQRIIRLMMTSMCLSSITTPCSR